MGVGAAWVRTTQLTFIVAPSLSRAFPSPFSADLTQMSSVKGLALSDVLTDTSRFAAALDLPPAVSSRLMEKLADIEHRLAFGTNDRIQAASLVAAFMEVRESLKAGGAGAGAGAGAAAAGAGAGAGGR